MEDKESGSLNQKSALDILLELHQGSVTGSLKLERPPLQKAVYFRDGQILFAASNDPKDQLASILVEEGKLGPEQMEVAQARATPGNPLAKVLTELGYISQRELADAARIKVEKILTDLYTWQEGSYQFATKSLPKGALDLELSTSRLLFASIRRIQDRDWVLSRLGSLEAVLRPSASFDSFIAEAKAEGGAEETLRMADGVKTIKQIGALSSLGEFEVCKVLAAALVGGGLEDGGAIPIMASDAAFSLPTEPPPFSPPTSDAPSFGNETVGLENLTAAPPTPTPLPTPTPPPPPPPPDRSGGGTASDTIFQPPPVAASQESDRTIFDEMPSPGGTSPSFGSRASASELLVEEPEPESDFSRTAPKPKRMQRGGGGGGAGGAVKWVALFALAAGAGFAVYYFVLPMLGGGDAGTNAGTSSTSTPSGITSTTPATSAAATDPRATGTTPSPTPTPATTPATTSLPSSPGQATSSAPTTTAPATTSTTSVAPQPGGTSPPAGSGSGRAMLSSGDVYRAADAFLAELSSSSADQFTIAVGLYCNADNVQRIAADVNDDALYVLPTSIDGRRCYRVVWGLFGSRDAAANAVNTLPRAISAGDAAPVDLSRLLR